MWTLHPGSPEALPLQWGVVVCACLVAAVTDLARRRIPNALTLPLLAAGVVFMMATRGLAGLADSAGACLLLGFPFVLLFVFAGGGSGDAKLMGAVGAWLGLGSCLPVLVTVCASGALLGLAFSVGKGRLRAVISNLSSMAQAVLIVLGSRGKFRDVRVLVPGVEEMQPLPYGVAIFMGIALAAAGALL